MLNRGDRPAAQYGVETPDQVLPAMGRAKMWTLLPSAVMTLAFRADGRESYGAAQHLMGGVDPRHSLAR
jgi:hypothetical protein